MKLSKRTSISASRASAFAIIAILCFATSATGQSQTVVHESHRLNVDGVERQFLVLKPETSEAVPRPLVFNFHGSGGSPEGQLANSDFESAVSKYGFIAVLPQGEYVNPVSSRSWNADLDPAGVDDVELVRAIIAELEREYAIDAARIYATGFSGGARMTSRLACELSNVLAAVAPVGGIQFGAGCDPERAIPLMTFHGKADRVNHYVRRGDSPPYWVNGVEESIGRWVDANGCDTSSQDEERVSRTVTHRVWDGCTDAVVVEAWIIDDGGHTWPGSPLVRESERLGITNQDIDATDLIWQFFARSRLP